jgi:hypothetical protein
MQKVNTRLATLKLILKKEIGRVWTGSIRLSIGTGGGLL